MNRTVARPAALLNRVLSEDPPGGLLLNIILSLILVALALAPFLFPGAKALGVASRICIFVILVASYDLMLGYTGIVSFAHLMVFGIGAYGVGILLAKGWVGWGAVLLGTACGVAIAAAVAVVIGALSLRVQAIFFAMITLAVASFALILAEQWRDLTGGEDGLSFSVPEVLRPSFHLFDEPVLGVNVNGTVITYYLTFVVALLLFLFMLRVVNSPFGRVLQAIRENEFRVEAMGYQVVAHRTMVCVIAAVMGALAGALMALVLRYVGPDATMSFSLVIDVLLMVVIGGMGTLYGAVIGAILVVMSEYYLRDVLGLISGAMTGIPLLSALFQPDRWLLWLGLLFVLVVIFFPQGIVGRLRRRSK
ncbi:MAG TPA: branched-chain amino acid ABC transporter permease [Burkholderiaceae bacterium]|nr:branched-chain amino acid ABC transporter permease [Burkholderiaceae bacterium]